MEYRLSELVGTGFWGAHRGIMAGDVTELVAKGGRGSGKSSFLSIELVLWLLSHAGCHGMAVRKVGATLRTSVYAQILWAIRALGLGGHFRCTVNPLECEYIPTGQKILFLGMDDPGKLKSMKMPFGHIGVLWLEELDQFDGPEEVRSVEQSVFRGGDQALSLKSFNPPADPAHWVNRFALEEKPGRLVHHSTYLQMPEKWLGQRFLMDAKYCQEKFFDNFRHEYLGECVGLGGAVFGNLELRSISDQEIGGFDRIYCGVDWGWWPDPWAFNRMHYDAGRRCLYIFEEKTAWRTPNAVTGRWVKERVGDDTVIADSAERKSISDYRELGIRCRGAKKGPGSVGLSMRWLAGLEKIVIDPSRCPDTAREFREYSYEKAGGRWTGEYPDRDNHHIDAVRYGLSRLWG